MRCPTCGTENAPDSRFCGGCGARSSGEQRAPLAPTQKISDDAKWSDRPPLTNKPPTASGPAAAYISQPPQMPPRLANLPQESRAMVGNAQTQAAQSVRPSQVIQPVQPAQAIQPIQPVRPLGSGAKSIPPVSPRRAPPDSQPSMEVPARGKGLIVVVLIVDLGLAAAGAYLLSQGLSGG